VALAGGAKYAEREVCERKIETWRSGADGKFDETAFLKTVREGRTELALGWASFLSLNFFFVTCIAFPTNPGAKFLEKIITEGRGNFY